MIGWGIWSSLDKRLPVVLGWSTFSAATFLESQSIITSFDIHDLSKWRFRVLLLVPNCTHSQRSEFYPYGG